ncbi:isoprenylcysteine carboxylmethyltransferase family protein [Mesorhizobium sp. STM 4661]|uniref:methyltransferase family protein n=1 Tax=Mesorhizobium sp. STM 4661 TaxID=1297570 RepID=UPI0012F757EC|nr:isoprenylcysteine carboxylmethyltransferase family protein [Mesorhizobium sp. STM 4661]
MRKTVLAITAVPLAIFLLFTHSLAETGSLPHIGVELIGWAAIVICIIGRSWCSLYVGGRKSEVLVRHGPYSVVRNPLYAFSILGSVGIGLASGSLVLGLAIGLIVFIVFAAVVRREERYLLGKLGDDYQLYLLQVPRWIPHPSLWRDASTVTVSPVLIVTTFFDAMWFALAIPVFEVLERLQNLGIVPVLALLP